MELRRDERDVMEGVRDRGEALVGRAVQWCLIPSGSRDLDGLARQLEVLETAFGGLPGEVARRPLAPSSDVDAQGRRTEQEHTDALQLTVRPEAPIQVVLTGHYDTVYGPESRFGEVRRRADGALNGPGIADMKGGLSVMLGALEAFETCAGREAVGYRVLLSPDEEVGSPASAPLLAELGRTAHLGLTFEPAMGEAGALASSRKGSGNFAVAVSGRAAHAGRDFAAGRNAVAAAARLAAALDELNGRLGGVTVNVARIDGGGALNVVPASAVVRFNVRTTDETGARWAEEQISKAVAAAARQDGITLVRHGGFTRPPKPANGAQQALFAGFRAAGADLGIELDWAPSGGVCEGNNLFAAGLPNLDTLGVRGGAIHSLDEFAWPDSFAERAALSALALMRMASGDIDARGIKAMMGAG
ncbi:MAG: hydrolase [Proteobacteria bacterium]|nr:hydrolase [Pseudomonadota bacterium]